MMIVPMMVGHTIDDDGYLIHSHTDNDTLTMIHSAHYSCAPIVTHSLRTHVSLLVFLVVVFLLCVIRCSVLLLL